MLYVNLLLQKYERCDALLHCQVRLESIERRPHLKLLPVTDDLSLPASVFASGKGQNMALKCYTCLITLIGKSLIGKK